MFLVFCLLYSSLFFVFLRKGLNLWVLLCWVLLPKLLAFNVYSVHLFCISFAPLVLILLLFCLFRFPVFYIIFAEDFASESQSTYRRRLCTLNDDYFKVIDVLHHGILFSLLGLLFLFSYFLKYKV